MRILSGGIGVTLAAVLTSVAGLGWSPPADAARCSVDGGNNASSQPYGQGWVPHVIREMLDNPSATGRKYAVFVADPPASGGWLQYYNKLGSQGLVRSKLEHPYGHELTVDNLGPSGVKAWFDNY